MHLVMVGLSHESAPVEWRERVSFTRDAAADAVGRLVNDARITEAVLLSTCNRTEIYVLAETVPSGEAVVRELFLQRAGESLPFTGDMRADRDAMHHLFRVAAGLESLVLGEGQILAQVKAALEIAMERGAAGPILERCFQAAIKAGKRARHETDIARGAVSVSHVAIALASEALEGLEGRSILLLGAGKMSELAARHLENYRPGRIRVANRSLDSAMSLARTVGGEAVPWIDLATHLAQADVVLCCTGAPHLVLTRADVEAARRADEAGRRQVFIDISVPRNLDPAIAQIPGVVLHDVDGLREVANRNRHERESAVEAVRAILESELSDVETWIRNLRVTPMIASLRSRIQSQCETELGQFWSRHAHDFSQEQQAQVELLVRGLVNKVLHQPTTELKRLPEPQLDRHTAVLGQLFGLSIEPASEVYRRKVQERRIRSRGSRGR